MKLFLILAFLAFSNGAKFHAEIETLEMVQVIFRHGDRGPTNQYPNDPVNQNPTAWPEGLAQLTSIGKMQQYNLGQYLRARYNGFLGNKYSSEELYVMSSDMDRTIMSVESNLAGLYPPVRKWHPHLDWQPIPLRTIPWKEDKYLHMNTHCPKYDRIHHEFLKTSEVVRNVNEENKEFVQYLATQSGIKATTVKEIIHLQDIILTEWLHNLNVPEWALSALPRLNALQAEVNTWSTYTEAMKRLHGGPLLDLLLKNMLAKTGALKASLEERRIVVGGGKRKMLMFSAHDSTLARIMNTIGIFHPHNPPYASALMFELHWDPVGLNYFVQIFYRNGTNGPHLMTVPGCDNPCSLTHLIEVTRHLIPGDFEKECKWEGDSPPLLKLGEGTPTTPPPTCITYTYPDPTYLAILAALVFLGAILTTIIVSSIIRFYARRHNQEHLWSSAKLLGRDQVAYERI